MTVKIEKSIFHVGWVSLKIFRNIPKQTQTIEILRWGFDIF
jgi:hypothetical protein